MGTLFGIGLNLHLLAHTHTLQHERCVRTDDQTAQSTRQKNISVTTTGATSSAVIVTLWTACFPCHGQLSSPGPRVGPARYLA